MNKIYKTKTAKRPLDIVKIRWEHAFHKLENDTLTDEQMQSRITGSMCQCNGNGEFILLPLTNRGVTTGGKRYMYCKICGEHSHL